MYAGISFYLVCLTYYLAYLFFSVLMFFLHYHSHSVWSECPGVLFELWKKKEEKHEMHSLKELVMKYLLSLHWHSVCFILCYLFYYGNSCYWPQFFLKPLEFVIQSFISHIQGWVGDKPACYTLKHHHYMLGKERENELNQSFIILM